MDCLFCRIANKEIVSEIIYEDNRTLAFLDIHPLTEGHTLIIPKYHVENILGAQDDDLAQFFKTVKLVTQKLNNNLHPQGFTIGINQGKISGQSIDHLHIHVIPRYEGDGGGSLHKIVDYPPKSSLKDTKSKIIQ